MGRAGFGVISGMLGAPYMLGFAAGPTLAAVLWGAAGYDAVIALGVVMALIGLGLVLLARKTHQSS